jgi:PhnB protein
MAGDVKPIPAGYHSVTPYLYLRDAAAAIEFYQKAFNAVELFRMAMPDGRIGHAEIKIGNSHVMLADEMPEMNITSPASLNGTSVGLLIYLENVDDQFEQAIAAGGEVIRPLTDQFYGDRSGTLKDPFGHTWTLSTHVEDVPPEELQQRMEAMCEGGE